MKRGCGMREPSAEVDAAAGVTTAFAAWPARRIASGSTIAA